MPTIITTPTGRIVWGNPSKAQQKKYQDGPNKGQAIMKDGQPVLQWPFGVAFPKEATLRAMYAADPNLEQIVATQSFERAIWPALAQEAATGYPNGVPPRFAWKFHDGDGVDSNGKPFRDREGYAGHIVLTIASNYAAPSIFKFNGASYDQLQPDAIKTGDYVAVGLNIVVNVATGTNTPSLYINPTAVEFVGYGTEIQSQGAADPNAVFGGQARALPPGATATPVGAGPGAMAMPGSTAMPAPVAVAPAAMPAPIAAPAPVPMAPPPPVTPPPPPALARPVDPSHIQPNPAGGEFWWNGTAWIAAPVAVAPAAPVMPPPAPDFVHNAGMPAAAPAMPAMPGMPAPR